MYAGRRGAAAAVAATAAQRRLILLHLREAAPVAPAPVPAASASEATPAARPPLPFACSALRTHGEQERRRQQQQQQQQQQQLLLLVHSRHNEHLLAPFPQTSKGRFDGGSSHGDTTVFWLTSARGMAAASLCGSTCSQRRMCLRGREVLVENTVMVVYGGLGASLARMAIMTTSHVQQSAALHRTALAAAAVASVAAAPTSSSSPQGGGGRTVTGQSDGGDGSGGGNKDGSSSGSGGGFWRMVGRAAWVAVLLLPCGIAAFLGTWQLQRRQWKMKLVEEVHERLSRPPIGLAELLRGRHIEKQERGVDSEGEDKGSSFSSWNVNENNSDAAEGEGGGGGGGDASTLLPRDLEFRRVWCEGVFDTSRSLLLGPRARTVHGVAEKGYFLITPLLPLPGSSDQPAVLVNRGWVPEGWKEEEEEKVVNGENVKTQGWLQPGGARERGHPGAAEKEREVQGSVSSQSWWHWVTRPLHQQQKQDDSSKAVAAEAAVVVVGVVRGSEQPNAFVPMNVAEQGQWFYVDVPAMARACGLAPSADPPVLLEATDRPQTARGNTAAGADWGSESEGAEGRSRSSMLAVAAAPQRASRRYPLPKDVNDLLRQPVMPQDHLNYALTWYTLFVATSIMAYHRLRGKRTKRQLAMSRRR